MREPPASFFYDRRFPVSVTIHAAERMRRLVAQSMGYAPPEEIDYGLDVAGERPPWLTPEPYLVGLHATARPDKTWAEDDWLALAVRAARPGSPSCCRGAREKRAAALLRIAAASPRAIVPPSLGFHEMAALQAGAAAVVGVDTGLTHLASAVGAPVVAIYAASWSEFNGVIGPAFVANLGGPGAPPGRRGGVGADARPPSRSGRKDRRVARGGWRSRRRSWPDGGVSGRQIPAPLSIAASAASCAAASAVIQATKAFTCGSRPFAFGCTR